MTSEEFVGAELEQSYAELFGTCATGGLNDGGKDVPTGNENFPAVQVKSSVKHAIEFLAESLRRRRFIPICIGDRGASKEEVFNSLEKFGGWVGHNIPRRDERLLQIRQARQRICGT